MASQPDCRLANASLPEMALLLTPPEKLQEPETAMPQAVA
jgi:hypothetical protein